MPKSTGWTSDPGVQILPAPNPDPDNGAIEGWQRHHARQAANQTKKLQHFNLDTEICERLLKTIDDHRFNPANLAIVLDVTVRHTINPIICAFAVDRRRILKVEMGQGNRRYASASQLTEERFIELYMKFVREVLGVDFLEDARKYGRWENKRRNAAKQLFEGLVVEINGALSEARKNGGV